MAAEPLDLDDVPGVIQQGRSEDRPLQERADTAHALAAGTVIGHVHLHVANLANLAEAEAFYVGVLGFDLMQRYGLNTWAGVGAPPPPPGRDRPPARRRAVPRRARAGARRGTGQRRADPDRPT